jgi:hypothetical protein
VTKEKRVLYVGVFHGKTIEVYKHQPTGDWVDAEDCSVIYPFEEFRSPVKKESK